VRSLLEGRQLPSAPVLGCPVLFGGLRTQSFPSSPVDIEKLSPSRILLAQAEYARDLHSPLDI